MIPFTHQQRIAAMDAAYRYALDILTVDYPASDIDEIAGIAAEYTLINWPEWARDASRSDAIRRVEEMLCC